MKRLPGVERIVRDAVIEVCDTYEIALPEGWESNSELFGKDGLLSSIALVSLVALVEEMIENETREQLILADDKALSLRQSPFRSIDAFTSFIEARLNGVGV